MTVFVQKIVHVTVANRYNMGRLAKQKRILIEEANKRLLNESFYDVHGTPIGVNSKHEPITEGESYSNEVLELIEMIETIHSQSKDAPLDERWIGWKIIMPKVEEMKSNII